MPWVWPKDVDAARSGLLGHYGDDFDIGVERLTVLLTRRDESVFGLSNRRPVAYAAILASARTLVALSRNPDFNAGVIAMAAALLPGHYMRQLPGDVEELRGKFAHQQDLLGGTE